MKIFSKVLIAAFALILCSCGKPDDPNRDQLVEEQNYERSEMENQAATAFYDDFHQAVGDMSAALSKVKTEFEVADYADGSLDKMNQSLADEMARANDLSKLSAAALDAIANDIAFDKEICESEFLPSEAGLNRLFADFKQQIGASIQTLHGCDLGDVQPLGVSEMSPDDIGFSTNDKLYYSNGYKSACAPEKADIDDLETLILKGTDASDFDRIVAGADARPRAKTDMGDAISVADIAQAYRKASELLVAREKSAVDHQACAPIEKYGEQVAAEQARRAAMGPPSVSRN